MPPLNVLVVGASIAGPSTAYWLARAGCRVTVIERFPSFRTSGQNLDIRTCGVTVMRKIPGMEAAVRARNIQLEGLAFVRDDGSRWGTLRASGDADRQGLVSEFEIYRGDLAGVLYDVSMEVGRGRVAYVFGEQVGGMRRTGGGPGKGEGAPGVQGEGDLEPELVGPITVDFISGRPSASYDLVVACDGATSRTRAMGLVCSPRAHVHPVNMWAAYFSIPDILDGGRVGLGLSAIGGRFVSVKPDRDRRDRNRVTLMGICPRGEAYASALEPFRQAQREGEDALKTYIANLFVDAGWRTPEVVRHMMASDDFYATEVLQVKPPTLHKGRFVLVGDAGYAAGPTGGGTSLALTGGYILAGEIASRPDDLAAALRAYEARMRPIIHDLQKIPSLVPGVMAPQTEWGIWVRNVIFALVTWMAGTWWVGYLGGLLSRWASSFAEGDKYGIPEYTWPEGEADGEAKEGGRRAGEGR